LALRIINVTIQREAVRDLCPRNLAAESINRELLVRVVVLEYIQYRLDSISILVLEIIAHVMQ
jgi:hypothetical protein